MTGIVICEKPSQAKDISAAVGNTYGRVLACQGHLLRLAEPKEVNEEWADWGYDVLQPPHYYPWREDGGDGRGARLKDIREALKGADEVTIATDCDREGQVIGESLLEHYKFKGKVFRAMFTAQDKVTLQAAFEARKPNREFRGLYEAGVARSQSDQVYNFTLTRVATMALRAPGEKGVIGIGRVRTPTLALAARRELEITNFKPTYYFEVTVEAETASGTLALRHAPGEEERLMERAAAQAIAAAAEGFEGPLKVTRKKARRRPPRLPDLPSLQKKAGAWGWTADRTLEVAQTLYEKHLMSYPRAEAPWLEESQIAEVAPLLKKLAAVEAYAGLVPAEPEIRKGKSGHFCSKCLQDKGLSHHAVIPNLGGLDGLAKELAGLGKDERRLFDYVARTFIAAVSPDYEYEATTVEVVVDGHAFAAKGAVPLVAGWRAVWGRGQADDEDDGEEKEGQLPPVKDGETASLSGAAIEDKETRPPGRFHDGGLIDAMQNAWRFVDDEALAERLKEANGIGTPATRAEIIKGLKTARPPLLVTRGKHVVPSEEGMKLYLMLAEEAPVLVDPGATARWELRLDEVQAGRVSGREVWDEISAEAGRQVKLLREAAAAGGAVGGAPRPPSEKMLAAARAAASRKGIDLPAAAETSFAACKAFLDAHPPGEGPPSPASLAFAVKLAGERGIDLPEDARTAQAACSAFIDKHRKKGGGKGRAKRR